MPHRFHAISYILATATEGLTLGLAAVLASLNAIIDEESWDRMTGKHGALFVMAIALLIFWNSNRLREKRGAQRELIMEEREIQRRAEEEAARERENEARDRRHKEAMDMQHRNSEQLAALTAEGIKAQLLTAQALKDVKRELDSRPCATLAKQ